MTAIAVYVLLPLREYRTRNYYARLVVVSSPSQTSDWVNATLTSRLSFQDIRAFTNSASHIPAPTRTNYPYRDSAIGWFLRRSTHYSSANRVPHWSSGNAGTSGLSKD